MAIMLLLTEFSRQKSPLQPITFTGMNLRQKGLHHKMAIPFLAFQYGVFQCNTGMISCKGPKGTL